MLPIIGEAAPNFATTNQNGDPVRLDQFRGKKLALYFYPKDSTKDCTVQACDLRDNYQSLKAKGYEILGVSPNTAKEHNKFIKNHELPFDILMDEDHAICLQYGVWIEKSMYGRKYMGIKRTTFIIDADGLLERIIEKVETSAHAAQIA